MNPSTRTESTNCEVTVHIEVSSDTLRAQEEEFLKKVAEEVRVPGFRQGKAPRDLLLRHYGEQAFLEDLRDYVVRRAAKEALARVNEEILSTPKVEGVQFRRGEALTFRLRFAVLPRVNLPDPLDLSLPEAPPAEVTEADVEEALASLRRDAAVLEPKSGPAEQGDVVQFRRGERVWQGEVGGEGRLGRQLLGARAGQRVALSGESGPSQDFEVMGVYKVVLPTLEEAAAHYGQESWEGLREEVRQELVRQAEHRRRDEERRAALDALADRLGLEVPPLLLAERVEEEMRALGLRREAKDELEAALKRRLRRELLAQVIARRQGLTPNREEVRQLAQALGREEGEVEGRLVFERAADWVLTQTRRSA